jgi:hypothetical protein
MNYYDKYKIYWGGNQNTVIPRMGPFDPEDNGEEEDIVDPEDNGAEEDPFGEDSDFPGEGDEGGDEGGDSGWHEVIHGKHGELSEGGGWIWNVHQESWEATGPTEPFRTFDGNITTKTVLEPGVWEKQTFKFIINSQWDLQADSILYVYGHKPGGSGPEGILWVDDLNISFIFSSTTTSTPVYKPYTAKITEVIDVDTIKVDKTWNEQAENVGHIDGELGSTTENYPYSDWQINFTVGNPRNLNTYLNFGQNRQLLTVNFEKDDDTYPTWPYSIVYKLYKPLPNTISEGDLCTVVREMMPSYQERVNLHYFIDEEIDAIVLRSPSLGSVKSAISNRTTNFRKRSELLTSDPKVAKVLADEFLSGSDLVSADINIDYSKWDNFITFGSSEKRLKNFKYKFSLIESYSNTSASYAVTNVPATASLTTEVKRWEIKRTEVISNFDTYDKYFYINSSSYSTSSLGEYFDNSWPKSGGSGTLMNPYVLYPTTSSEATTWYDNQIASASLYDRMNRNKLTTNIPNFVVDDSDNAPFVNLIDMAGHFYDNILVYIKHMLDVHERTDTLTDGIPKKLIYAIGKSIGLDIKDGTDLLELPRYVLGLTPTGSNWVDYSTTPEREISREIWNRIINNLPFFLKTKGTTRALKGLINCYGIPSSILRVREYGGPDVAAGDATSYEIIKKFTRAIDFKGGQYVSTTWVNDTNSGRKPDTIELRFKSLASDGSTNRVLAQGGTNWGIRLLDNGSSDNMGTVGFRLSGSNGYTEISSSQFPVFDGEFYSVMLNRVSSSKAQLTSDTATQDIDYRLSVKKYDSGRSKIYLSSTVSMSIDGDTSSSYNTAFTTNNTVYIGGTGATFGSQMTGSMMEFRYWTTALSMSAFDNHVSAPKAYNGNHASASWTDLVLRYSFDDNKNLYTDTSIRDTSADQSYIQNGTANGYTNANIPHFSPVVDEHKMYVPNVGPNRRTANKIRIEENKIPKNADGTITLDVFKRREVSAFDTAPIDSNKLGVYFSPTDVINEDIMLSVANLDFNQYIGDPRDKYKYTYRGLGKVRASYWQKYSSPTNFWDYLRLLKYYDQSLFDNIESFIPARASKRVGVLVEPNIFERPKVLVSLGPPELENTYYESTIPIYNYIDSIVSGSGEESYYEASSSYGRDFLQKATLYKLSGPLYATSSITAGGPEYVFSEGAQPFISSSRLSEHNQIKLNFYSSSISHSLGLAYSSSYKAAEYENIGYGSDLFRLYYSGAKQTKYTTPDGGLPVEITVTSPTVLVTQEPGKSALKVK